SAVAVALGKAAAHRTTRIHSLASRQERHLKVTRAPVQNYLRKVVIHRASPIINDLFTPCRDHSNIDFCVGSLTLRVKFVEIGILTLFSHVACLSLGV